MSFSLWQQCLIRLQNKLPATEFSMWIRPLQAELSDNTLELYAPNRFVLDWVRNKYINSINKLLSDFCGSDIPILKFKIGNKPKMKKNNNLRYTKINKNFFSTINKTFDFNWNNRQTKRENHYKSQINPKNTFNNFVEGKSNQLAKAASKQVANNLGWAYNPLFLYGSTGLGKTHLLHAVGNKIIKNKINAKITYIHSEGFVQNMVKALKNNSIENFKNYYRSLNALLIDDIQFFANKERSQEEFFHTFNTLLEKNQQIILTSDKHPKEIIGMEDRLKSRFGWGLTVAINPPGFKTRISILIKKAEENNIKLSKKVAFFIAKRLKSNIRELEGALNKIIAYSNFTKSVITINVVQEALKDLFALQEKLISIENIQKIVSEYYRIKITDLLSKRRSRSITRPRQTAMALAKKLTNHSLPEIGNAFGGRDHTTVIHACKKIEKLQEKNHAIKEDFLNLIKILSS